jgi:hypothetical protein
MSANAGKNVGATPFIGYKEENNRFVLNIKLSKIVENREG